MSKVAVVTDSTAYIPEHLCNGFVLHTIPLQVIWGEETFRDGIDITPLEFYTRLQNAKVMPTTSQPSPAAFQQVYSSLLEQGYDILSIHISAALSGTIDSATQAKNMLHTDRIEIVDSLSAGMGLGFQALQVARAAKTGASLRECKEIAEKAVKHTGVLFAVSTLEFLHRGGRIGGAAAFLGTALGLKPILGLQDGKIVAVEKIRTMNKAVEKVIDLFVQRVGNQRPVRIAALHANAPAEAERVLEKACQRFDPADIAEAFAATVSPVIGTHTGPGTVGIAFMAGM
ncbi:MAG: DegV family protein [Chloroflexota bacterium]